MTKEDIFALANSPIRILVLGDLMLDRYLFTGVTRVSPEAPVPVCNLKDKKAVLGGAGNVALNLATFGVDISLCGLVGGGLDGDEFIQIAEQHGINCDGVKRTPARRTSVKTRLLGNGQQIARIDSEDTESLSLDEIQLLERYLESHIKSFDLVVLSDYSKGVMTQDFIDTVRENSPESQLLVVDPHPSNSVSWAGMDLIKPNLKELSAFTGIEINELLDPLENKSLKAATEQFFRQWSPTHLLVTLGSGGMLYVSSEEKFLRTALAQEVYDVSGAGDTSIAYCALALAAGWEVSQAVDLAILASSLVVSKVGTATLTLEELTNALN